MDEMFPGEGIKKGRKQGGKNKLSKDVIPTRD